MRTAATANVWTTVSSLYEDEVVPQTQLARIEHPTMALTLKRMERDGLVSRHADGDDRGQSRIRLTARGRKAEASVNASEPSSTTPRRRPEPRKSALNSRACST